MLDAPSPLPTRRYRRASLGDICADSAGRADIRSSVEPQQFLAPSALDVPRLQYGTTDMGKPGIELQQNLGDPGGSTLSRSTPTPAFLLRDAMVHLKYGVITLGDRVVEESLYHFPIHLVPGAAWDGERHLQLPELPLSASQQTAYHLLACNQDNYFHWLIDLVARFRISEYQALELDARTLEIPKLLLPPLDTAWKSESLFHSISRLIPRFTLAPAGRLFIDRLFYVPDLSGAGFNPHPAILDAFTTIRASVLGHDPLPRPWRRLYISREDSGSRVLINEPEVMERTVRAGFTPVILSKLSVPDQVRLFAEASHVVAPHGAGVTNIGFCQPGARFCELHMDSYVHWSFRLLAALRGVHYGCLVGSTVGERHEWVHSNKWHLDPLAVDALLRDPKFIA
jgi:Glycosyltransferase 61